MTRRLTPCLLALALVVSACVAPGAPSGATPQASATTSPLTHIRLPVGYIPDIQFAPLYVAVANGNYARAGLEIEFDYKFENDGVALVGAGTLPFAVASGEQVLLARAQGLPVVYILAWYQKYPVAVIAKTQAGIHTPADLAGHSIGIPCLCGASYVGLTALLDSAGLKESDVGLEVIGFNQIAALTTDQTQAVVGYVSNEPIKLRASGVPIDVIDVADYAHLAANGLITNETVLREQPELVRAMVTATLAGMREAAADPQAAYAASATFVEGLSSLDPAAREIQMEVLRRSIEMWQAPRLGWSDLDAWRNTEATLRHMGQLTQPLDVSKAFSNAFIP
jgi:putative riboflavin transport system substrate-binding protein